MPKTRPATGTPRRPIIIVVAVAFAAAFLGAYLATLVLRPPSIILSTGSARPGKNPLSSVVTLRTRIGAGQGRYQERIGTAVVIDGSGHLVTNAHLVEGASQITVKPYRGRETVVTVVHSDKASDIAVISSPGLSLKPPSFYMKQLQLGQRVFAIGKPMVLSDEFTITSGIISTLPTRLTQNSPSLLKTDAAVNPGNSGGPLVDDKGRIVAITTAYLSSGENTPGIGFAVPIADALEIVRKAVAGK